MQEWLITVAREFPVTAMFGVAGWWVVRTIRAQHQEHNAQMHKVYAEALAGKDAEIVRLTAAREEEVKRLIKQLVDAQKERKDLQDRLVPRRDKP